MRKSFVWLLLCLLLPALALAQGPRSNPNINTLINDTSTGTLQYYLSKVVTPGKLIKALTTDTAVELYPCIAGCGTTGEAKYMLVGDTYCFFDAVNASGAAGAFVVASITTAGKCHAIMPPGTAPTAGMVIGKLLEDSTVTTNATCSGAIGSRDCRRVQVQNVNYSQGTSGTASINTGAAHQLGYYAAAGTVISPLTAPPTAGKGLIGNGTDWVTSTAGMAGDGACTNQFVRGTVANAAPTCNTVTSADVNTTIAITGSSADINASSNVVSAAGLFALKGDTTVTPGGALNDYAGCDGFTVCNINGGASDRTVSGFATGTDGRILLVRNVGTTNNLIFQDQSGSSTTGNQMNLGDTVTLQPGATFAIVYSTAGGLNRWQPWQSAMLASRAVRVCATDQGTKATSGTALVVDDNLTESCSNDYGKPWKLTAFACKTNVGSVTVRPILTGGANTSIVSSDVTCGTTWTAGTINGVPTLNPFNADGATCASPPCTADLTLVTVDGTAKRLQMKLIGSLQK